MGRLRPSRSGHDCRLRIDEPARRERFGAYDDLAWAVGTDHPEQRDLARELHSVLPGVQIRWRGRVLRHDLSQSTIGDATLGDALDRATWTANLAFGEVHRA